MLLFDWKKVFEVAEANPYKCFQIIKMLAYKEIPKNKYDPIYWLSQHDYTGESFLVHPEPLIHDSYKYTWREIGVYLALASARNTADYIATGDVTLNLYKIGLSELAMESMNENRLLTIEDDAIVHFLYEEVPHHSLEKH